MIIHDMRITLPDQPELTTKQNVRLNEAILQQRDEAEAMVRANEGFMGKTYNYGGYIHLTLSDRFFIYKMSLVIDGAVGEGYSWTAVKALDGETLAEIMQDEIGKTDPKKEANVYERKILKESTEEVTMNEWLDAYTVGSSPDFSKYPKHPSL